VQVPLLDLKPQYRPLAAEIRAVIAKVCESQHGTGRYQEASEPSGYMT
jgi:hypothetical protein